MKSQSQLVLTLKAQIAATLKLIALKIKRYVLQLLELEQKLEVAMSEQLLSLIGTEKQITWATKIRDLYIKLINPKEIKAIARQEAAEKAVEGFSSDFLKSKNWEEYAQFMSEKYGERFTPEISNGCKQNFAEYEEEVERLTEDSMKFLADPKCQIAIERSGKMLNILDAGIWIDFFKNEKDLDMKTVRSIFSILRGEAVGGILDGK